MYKSKIFSLGDSLGFVLTFTSQLAHPTIPVGLYKEHMITSFSASIRVEQLRKTTKNFDLDSPHVETKPSWP
jgi:hypothetical protein